MSRIKTIDEIKQEIVQDAQKLKAYKNQDIKPSGRPIRDIIEAFRAASEGGTKK